MMSILPFLLDEDLRICTEKIVRTIESRVLNVDRQLHRNVIDPFSAVFGCLVQGMEPDHWLQLEKVRQIQKTLENGLGEFHQDILSSLPGWERMDDVVDLKNRDLKMVAEVKNKFNVNGSKCKCTCNIVIFKELSIEFEALLENLPSTNANYM